MGDARRALMFQAALSKAVDYSKARLLDPAWWKYLNVMLKALEQQHGRHILELVVHYNLAKAGLDFLKTESRLDYAKEAIHRIGHIADSYEGVAPRSEQQIKADSARRCLGGRVWRSKRS